MAENGKVCFIQRINFIAWICWQWGAANELLPYRFYGYAEDGEEVMLITGTYRIIPLWNGLLWWLYEDRPEVDVQEANCFVITVRSCRLYGLYTNDIAATYRELCVY